MIDSETLEPGLEATLIASSGPVLSVEPSKVSTLVRSTVLPRLEIVDDRPTLVAREKPRYEKTGHLGEGGLGEVVSALDNDIGRQVAVKRLKPEVLSPAALARFVEEVRTIGVLEHPNIVPIHDVGVDENGDYFFVMKYVDGETLESIIEKLASGDRRYHEMYGVERRVQIFIALLDAVAFAHGKGVVHRDIKPANVMVGAYGEVMLMDWGVAQRTGDPSPIFANKAGELIGTPAYMSPEQARGEPVDDRSDVYSLSLLFHEFLCLRHPLEDKRTIPAVLEAVVNEEVPRATFVPSPHQPSTPIDLSWFVVKGVTKKREDRYQSVAEMIERLQQRAEGIIPIQCHVTFVMRVTAIWTRFVKRHPFAVSIGLVLVPLIFIAMIVLLLRRH